MFLTNRRQNEQNDNNECNVSCKRMKEDKDLTVWKEKKTGRLNLDRTIGSGHTILFKRVAMLMTRNKEFRSISNNYVCKCMHVQHDNWIIS